jgi:hypothetical protein
VNAPLAEAAAQALLSHISNGEIVCEQWSGGLLFPIAGMYEYIALSSAHAPLEVTASGDNLAQCFHRRTVPGVGVSDGAFSTPTRLQAVTQFPHKPKYTIASTAAVRSYFTFGSLRELVCSFAPSR